MPDGVVAGVKIDAGSCEFKHAVALFVGAQNGAEIIEGVAKSGYKMGGENGEQ